MSKLLVILLGALCFNNCAAQEIPTGRLLVNVAPDSVFTAGEFAEAVSALWVPAATHAPFGALQELFLDHPLVVISTSLQEKELRRLAMRHGYRYINFADETIDEAKAKTDAAIVKVPKYTSELPHLSVEETTRIYALLEKIDRVLTEHNIRYWSGRNILLGALRHSGLIPWDNDLSLYILDEDESKLDKVRKALFEAGVGLHSYFKDLYKLYDADGQVIPNAYKIGEIHPFLYPTVDLFVMTLEKRWTLQNESEEFYVHRSWDFYWWWGHDRFSRSQIEQISRAPYGPLSLPIPGEPEGYLNRLYGTVRYPDLWRQYTLEPVWDHRLEREPSKLGSALLKID